MPESSSDTSAPSSEGPVAGGVGLLAFGVAAAAVPAIFVLLLLHLRDRPWARPVWRCWRQPLLLLALPVAIGVAVRWPDAIVSALIVACIVFNQNLEWVGVRAASFTVYPQDVLLARRLCRRWCARRSREPAEVGRDGVGKWIAVAGAAASFQAGPRHSVGAAISIRRLATGGAAISI